jgi:hypothetical protein
MQVTGRLDTIIKTDNVGIVRKELREIVDAGIEDLATAKIRKLRENKVLTNKDIIDAIKDVLKIELD